jgi:hypothetical protein
MKSNFKINEILEKLKNIEKMLKKPLSVNDYVRILSSALKTSYLMRFFVFINSIIFKEFLIIFRLDCALKIIFLMSI